MSGHRASFASTRPSLISARRLVKQWATEAGFGEGEVFDIVLATGEASTNAVLHASSEAGFWLACEVFEHRLAIQVHDFGPGFSLQGRGVYIEPHLRSAGGLGIYIMRSLMDEVSFEMDESGTTVTLVKIKRPCRSQGGAPCDQASGR
ncbi:MAG: ATP-binding protein [Candidatus Eremiobacteraeota bacterium]|nr:ATP-binding protein [Candidatus Eremiobacteraeota bacterium]